MLTTIPFISEEEILKRFNDAQKRYYAGRLVKASSLANLQEIYRS